MVSDETEVAGTSKCLWIQPSFSSADEGAVLQNLVLERQGRSWMPEYNGSGSLLPRITSQNNNTEVETQSKILLPGQGVQKR